MKCVLVGFFSFFVSLAGLGQQTQQPGDEARPSLPEPATAKKHVPILGDLADVALVTDLQYYRPEPGFDRYNRDIDLQVARAALAAHFWSGWEFQVDAIAVRADGTRTLTSSVPNPSPVPSDALAFGAGPLARWNVLQFPRWRLFVDAQGDLILADRPFPARGTIYDFFLHGGGGISFRVSQSFWLETAYRLAHVSNAQGFVSDNPTWNGRGLSIGLRHETRHYGETRSASTPPAAQPEKGAWITSLENYWGVPGASRQPAVPSIRALRVSRAWTLPRGFELQAGGLFANPPHLVQGNEFAGIGPLIRWNLHKTAQWRMFGDAGADLLQTGSPGFIVPTPGDGYNFMWRTGGGASIKLHSSYSLETGVRWTHIAAGFGPGGADYGPWSGVGVSLSLRKAISGI
jgi:hypothetical protein